MATTMREASNLLLSLCGSTTGLSPGTPSADDGEVRVSIFVVVDCPDIIEGLVVVGYGVVVGTFTHPDTRPAKHP